MEYILDIKGLHYEQLLKFLFSHCDTVQCVMREDDPQYFDEIAYECLEKRYVTEWSLTYLGASAVPCMQYTFRCHYNTAQFFINKQQSLFSWLIPHPEDLSFWKGGQCLFAACSHEQLVYVDDSVQQRLAPFLTACL